MKKIISIALFVFLVGALSAQTSNIPDVPVLKGYEGKEGRITKFNFFNVLSLKDKSGENSRKSTGQYWEVSYLYDSAFRQKQKFGKFMEEQIIEIGGATFFQDTTAIHFAIPDDNGNIWGKVLLTSNRQYKLRLIKERAFNNAVILDGDQNVVFDDLVKEVELPPRIAFMPNSVVTRVEQSKFNHYEFNYVTDDQVTYKQSLMGPYWDFKIEIQDENGDVDKRVSYIEIQESYFRAAMKAGGKIVKNRAREIVFSLPGEDYTLWVRVSVSMDGVYFIKVIKQFPEDYKEPVLLYPEQLKDKQPSKKK